MRKAEQDRLAFEAEIRANAVSYRVHLFLGRGQYDRAEAATSDEALALGAAMKAAHPACQAQPMYYAIEPSGHSIPVTPAQMTQQEKTMTDTPAQNQREKMMMTGTQLPGVTRRLKKNAAQAAYRARKKAETAAGAALAVKAEQRLADRKARKAAAEASRKEVKAIKAERKAAKAKPAGRKAKAAAPRAAGGKRAEILAKAERGVLPPAPDFSAPTHARFRDKLAQVVAMAKAGDLAGLKAFEINPVSSSPKAIDRYRNLAIVAVKARAAKESAA